MAKNDLIKECFFNSAHETLIKLKDGLTYPAISQQVLMKQAMTAVSLFIENNNQFPLEGDIIRYTNLPEEGENLAANLAKIVNESSGFLKVNRSSKTRWLERYNSKINYVIEVTWVKPPNEVIAR